MNLCDVYRNYPAGGDQDVSAFMLHIWCIIDRNTYIPNVQSSLKQQKCEKLFFFQVADNTSFISQFVLCL